MINKTSSVSKADIRTYVECLKRLENETIEIRKLIDNFPNEHFGVQHALLHSILFALYAAQDSALQVESFKSPKKVKEI